MPGNSGRIGTYKIEVESPIGHGNFETTGVGSDRETRESLSTSFNYFKANKKSISSNINTETIDYLLHIQDLQGTGPSKYISKDNDDLDDFILFNMFFNNKK